MGADGGGPHGRPGGGGLSGPGHRHRHRLPGRPIVGSARLGPSYPQGWQPIVSTPAAGGRFSRGLRLVGIGFTMARDEPGLMMVPVVAFLLQLVIFGAGGLILLPDPAFDERQRRASPSTSRPASGWSWWWSGSW